MQTYNFTLILGGMTGVSELIEDKIHDKLFEAGCDDSMPGSVNNKHHIVFCREAEDFESAVVSAIADVESVEGLSVLAVDEYGLVGLAEAAVLAGVTKATMTRYNNGQRGSGTFPQPIQRIASKKPLWRWSDIANWLFLTGNLSSAKPDFICESNWKDNVDYRPLIVDQAEFVNDINIALSLRSATAFSKNRINELIAELPLKL